MKRLLLLLFCLFLTGCTANIPASLVSPTIPIVTETPLPAELPFDPYRLLAEMSLEERVGQLFFARCPENQAIADVERYHLGGYLLFGRDFADETPESIRLILEEYQATTKIPLLLAVDEEGGTVNRISRYPQFRKSPFPSPRSLYNRGGMAAVLETEAEKCALLKSLGIQVNLAPVCDVTTQRGAFMYPRSLGQGPEMTGEYAAAMVSLMQENGIGSVLKHFPGYGNNTDTHVGMARDERSLDTLEKNDLFPFLSGIQAGCGGILISHTIVACLDDAMPASLSPEVHRYLREVMGFTGVAVTDDLSMEAITDAYGAGEAAVLAVLAGNDLLCSTDYATQYAAVLEAAGDGRIPESRIDEAAARVILWKHTLGLLTE